MNGAGTPPAANPIPDTGAGTAWLSAYLFFGGWIYSPECDDVVRRVVEPFVRRARAEGWSDVDFFIRYSEFGPHVRLRLHGDPRVLDETVWPALVAHVRADSPDVVVGARPEEPTYEKRDAPVPVTHLARVAYEPETDRYGGPHALPVGERAFQVSSDAAFDLLRTVGAERPSRLGKGLLAMVVLVHVFCETRERASAFTRMYSTNYLRAVAREDDSRETWVDAFDRGFEQQAGTLGEYVEEVWSRMEEGEPLSDALDAWAAGMRARRDELRAVFDAGQAQVAGTPAEEWERVVMGIVPSYCHMMNNRLGITIQEESYLGHLITRALGQPADAAAGAA